MTAEKLVYFFIEGFLQVGAGLGVIGIRLKLKTMGIIAFIQALLVYGVRMFYIQNKIPFGTHFFVLFICFILLLKVIAKQKIRDSIIAGLIGFLLILWGEGVFLFPLLKLLQLDVTTLAAKPGGTLLGGMLSDILLIVGFFIGYVFKVTIIDFNHFHENNV